MRSNVSNRNEASVGRKVGPGLHGRLPEEPAQQPERVPKERAAEEQQHGRVEPELRHEQSGRYVQPGNTLKEPAVNGMGLRNIEDRKSVV